MTDTTATLIGEVHELRLANSRLRDEASEDYARAEASAAELVVVRVAGKAVASRLREIHVAEHPDQPCRPCKTADVLRFYDESVGT